LVTDRAAFRGLHRGLIDVVNRGTFRTMPVSERQPGAQVRQQTASAGEFPNRSDKYCGGTKPDTAPEPIARFATTDCRPRLAAVPLQPGVRRRSPRTCAVQVGEERRLVVATLSRRPVLMLVAADPHHPVVAGQRRGSRPARARLDLVVGGQAFDPRQIAGDFHSPGLVVLGAELAQLGVDVDAARE
jgi:hypothetical protein